MRFSINLATRSYIDQRLLNRIIALAMVVLVLLLGWNVARISWNLGEQGRLDSEVRAFETNLNARPGGISEHDFTRQQARVRFFNEIIDRKGTDWMRVLDLVETVTPEGIALAAFTPGKKNGELKLDGRARSFDVVRRYVENLEGSKLFSDVLLLSHQEMIVGEHGRGVRFLITCKVQF
ncbi:MAG: PilN domain-containing protein [Desulfuromonadales bacterium]